MRAVPLLLLFAISLSFASCASKEEKSIKKYGEQPDWVKKTPLSNSYYYGIGSISKTNPDYKNAAIKAALDNLINEISVVVSSTSTLSTLETNAAFKQEYSQKTQLFATEKIEGYELVGTWENDEYYYVFYQLSKVKHQQLKQQKIAKAIDRSKSTYLNGLKLQESKTYRESFINFIQALEVLTPHLDEDLNTDLNGKYCNLAVEIINQIRQIDQSFTIHPSFLDKNVKAGQYLNAEEVYVTVKDKTGKTIEGIPILFEYRGTTSIKERVSTNIEGVAAWNVGKMKSLKKHQEISVRLDFENLLKATTRDRLLEQLINLPNSSSLTMNLNVQAPSVFVIGKELLQGESINAAVNMENQIKTALLNNQFDIADKESQADLILIYEISSYLVNTNGSINVVSTGVTVTIKEKGKTIFSDVIPNQKGSHYSEREAMNSAYDKIAPYFSNRIIPKFSGEYFGY